MSSNPGTSPPGATEFHGGGALGALIRARDWSGTALGPIEIWPESLRTSVSLCLHSRDPIAVMWGPHLLTIYNDALVPVLSARHPRALGAPAREVWSGIWHVIEPMVQGVLAGGEPTWSEDLRLPLERHGFIEECHFTLALTPVREGSAPARGVFAALADTTARVIDERRLTMLHGLAAETLGAGSEEQACARAARVFGDHHLDAPFALFYLLDDTRRAARLVAVSGVEHGSRAAVPVVDVEAAVQPWPLGSAHGGRIVDDVADRFGRLAAEPWPEPVERAAILPLSRASGAGPLGYLVLGLSPRLAFDRRYARFVDLAAEHVSAAIEYARAYRREQQRAEALAEIDRAKDNFLAVLGHELRNPLAPIVTALELMKARGDRTCLRERAVIERQVTQLMRLVEDLLDVSRIARGKMELRREPIEIADVVARAMETARPLLEERRHQLSIDVPRTGLMIAADVTRLSQAVTNLVTNAAKYTEPGGRIEVRARLEDGFVVLSVRDNGIGIPPDMLPRIFEVFTQGLPSAVPAGGGLGLGLWIVRSLIELHGGTVEAFSAGVGGGSEFVVRIPWPGGAAPPPQRPPERRRAVRRD